MPDKGSVPSPAMDRSVSGRKSRIVTRTKADMLVKNMNIDLEALDSGDDDILEKDPYRNPKKRASSPPRTGPMAMLKFRTNKSINTMTMNARSDRVRIWEKTYVLGRN